MSKELVILTRLDTLDAKISPMNLMRLPFLIHTKRCARMKIWKRASPERSTNDSPTKKRAESEEILIVQSPLRGIQEKHRGEKHILSCICEVTIPLCVVFIHLASLHMHFLEAHENYALNATISTTTGYCLHLAAAKVDSVAGVLPFF